MVVPLSLLKEVYLLKLGMITSDDPVVGIFKPPYSVAERYLFLISSTVSSNTIFEGMKVPQKQPKRRRLWLNDGSCVRLRAEHARGFLHY